MRSVIGTTFEPAEGGQSAGARTLTLAYFALVNNTASLWSVPRASAINFPSGDQPKSQTTPDVKWVNCFGGPSGKIQLQRLGVWERMSTAARERPSGVQRRPSGGEVLAGRKHSGTGPKLAPLSNSVRGHFDLATLAAISGAPSLHLVRRTMDSNQSTV